MTHFCGVDLMKFSLLVVELHTLSLNREREVKELWENVLCFGIFATLC